MKSLNRYRVSWLKSRKGYERIIYKIFKDYFKNAGNRINFQYINEQNYEAQINADLKIYDFYKVYYDAYLAVGVIHGKRIGREINRDIKDFNPVVFENEYQRNLYNWIVENIGQSILSIHNTFKEYIVQLIAKAIQEGRTIDDISDDMVRLINSRSFYRWQALRIARTETTSAANHAATRAGEISGIATEKVWISATDVRTRRIPKDQYDHLVMNGKRVDSDGFFEVPNKFGGVELLPYPGSKRTATGASSSAGDVINCRCTVAQVPKRDSEGRIIRL